MRKIIKKSVAVAFVAVFARLAFGPAVSAESLTVSSAEQSVDVEVSVYDGQGQIQTESVSLLASEIEQLKESLMEASVDEQMGILSDFGLISEDLVDYDWQSELEQNALRLGLNPLKKNKVRLGMPVVLRLFNKVGIVSVAGGSTRIGITPALRLIELITPLKLNRVDLLDTCWGLMTVSHTKGLLTEHTVIGPSFNVLIGFVGVSIKIPLVATIYSGYSAVTGTIGLGAHFIHRGIDILPDAN